MLGNGNALQAGRGRRAARRITWACCCISSFAASPPMPLQAAAPGGAAHILAGALGVNPQGLLAQPAVAARGGVEAAKLLGSHALRTGAAGAAGSGQGVGRVA